MGGGGGCEGRGAEAHLPGQVLAWERHTVRAWPAHRQDRGHASCTKGELAAALVARRPPSKEDEWFELLRQLRMQHSLGSYHK